jgi:uncharacterized protein YecE (DUF72 family)
MVKRKSKSSRKSPEYRIGISGWRYEPWRGKFYPEDLNQKRELWYASRQVNSIELNGSFYSLQRPQSYKAWYAETPEDFKFAVKANRYITHIRRLRDVEAPVGNFIGSGVLHFKEKLGPFLWQFPPNFVCDLERIDKFLEMLPRTFAEAVQHSKHYADRVTPDFPDGAEKSDQILRHAFEIRHYSFENPEFIELLRKHNIAIVFADTAGQWPYIEDVTADFIYCRLHGEEKIYASGYGDASLDWWAKRICTWSEGALPKDAMNIVDVPLKKQPRDIFVYFDNDVKVHAPYDAQGLAKRVGII